MKISVVEPPFNDTHYVYKVDIETAFSNWSVIKRFSQFIEVDKELQNDFSFEMKEIIKLPKKKIFNSLDYDVKSERASTLGIYLSEISKDEKIMKSQTIARFLRSDVYLESYIDLVEGDELRELKLRSDNLLEKTRNLLQNCNENQIEISNTYEQFNSCESDIKELKNKLDSLIRHLERVSFLRSKNREIKSDIISNLNCLTENYKNLNQILNVNKENIWKKITNMSLIKDDLTTLSISINRLNESLDNYSPRASSSDINDIRTKFKILKEKSDIILSQITTLSMKIQ